MSSIVLLRHGESLWNKANRFTGWVDIDLSLKGVAEAQKAGLRLKAFDFDVAYTSFLKRAIKTLWIVLEETDRRWVPVVKSWRLNERHYGSLQGLNKKETMEKYGEAQVFEWRRSFKTPPPAIDLKDSLLNTMPYKQIFNQSTIPLTESLQDCQKRVLPLWVDSIQEDLKKGKKVLVVAHGNSLRALIQKFQNLSEEEISKVNIDTGKPLFYEFDTNFKVKKEFYI